MFCRDRRRLLVTLVIGCFYTLITACGSGREESAYETIEFRSQDFYDGVRLSDIYDAEWETVALLLPYDDVRVVETKTGIKFGVLFDTGLSLTDEFSIIAFISGRTVDGVIFVPQSAVPLNRKQQGKIVLNRTAKLVFSEKDQTGFITQ